MQVSNDVRRVFCMYSTWALQCRAFSCSTPYKVSVNALSPDGVKCRYLHENATQESNGSSNVDRYETIACISTGFHGFYPRQFQLTLCEAQKR